MKKYLVLFALQIAANLLWAFWALPLMLEQGSSSQTLNWLLVQTLFPVLWTLLLARKWAGVYVLLVIYGVLIVLYGIGTLGWALMGEGTPLAVYVVCGIFLVTGFGCVFCALKDLNVGKNTRTYHGIEDE